ncbi:addiction module protein [uncultured Nostoc sp.]|uniref:addiction module protein n=1 Tax=uncultured Nostoc sp. TaxID=340711 RepID=UPI0035C98465
MDAENQAEIDAIWAEEAEKRFQAVGQGEVNLIPGEQVLRELRSRSDLTYAKIKTV